MAIDLENMKEKLTSLSYDTAKDPKEHIDIDKSRKNVAKMSGVSSHQPSVEAINNSGDALSTYAQNELGVELSDVARKLKEEDHNTTVSIDVVVDDKDNNHNPILYLIVDDVGTGGHPDLSLYATPAGIYDGLNMSHNGKFQFGTPLIASSLLGDEADYREALGDLKFVVFNSDPLEKKISFTLPSGNTEYRVARASFEDFEKLLRSQHHGEKLGALISHVMEKLENQTRDGHGILCFNPVLAAPNDQIDKLKTEAERKVFPGQALRKLCINMFAPYVAPAMNGMPLDAHFSAFSVSSSGRSLDRRLKIGLQEHLPGLMPKFRDPTGVESFTHIPPICSGNVDTDFGTACFIAGELAGKGAGENVEKEREAIRQFHNELQGTYDVDVSFLNEFNNNYSMGGKTHVFANYGSYQSRCGHAHLQGISDPKGDNARVHNGVYSALVFDSGKDLEQTADKGQNYFGRDLESAYEKCVNSLGEKSKARLERLKLKGKNTRNLPRKRVEEAFTDDLAQSLQAALPPDLQKHVKRYANIKTLSSTIPGSHSERQLDILINCPQGENPAFFSALGAILGVNNLKVEPGKSVIIELKVEPLSDGCVSQVLEYQTHYLSKDRGPDETIDSKQSDAILIGPAPKRDIEAFDRYVEETNRHSTGRPPVKVVYIERSPVLSALLNAAQVKAVEDE